MFNPDQLFSLNFISTFLILAGLIVGLGGVTVIDFLGFFSQNSSYWTLATTRAHKITKWLIYLGVSLLLIGKFLQPVKHEFFKYEMIVFAILIANATFLSFIVSPYLIRREKEGKDNEILPKDFQKKIMFSFILSFICWWSIMLFTAAKFSGII